MPDNPIRIAMWSGPRNLSTALMYSFASRGDCAVVDEPFYAAYLAETGLAHPMLDEVLASQSQDPDEVISTLVGEVPDGNTVYYQKHMTQHMIPEISRDWITELTNVFLIRHPARVIASYVAKRENPVLSDLGFVQQEELFNMVLSKGGIPVVVDSSDIRANPDAVLQRLCDAIEISYTPNMLRWAKGGHPSDGIWAPHWYGAVWDSETFAGAEGPLPEIPNDLKPLLSEAMPIYERMRAVKI